MDDASAHDKGRKDVCPEIGSDRLVRFAVFASKGRLNALDLLRCVHLRQRGGSRVQRPDAAVDHNLQRREVLLQAVPAPLVEGRHLAALLRAEAAAPGLAEVNRDAAPAGGGDRATKLLRSL